MEGLGGCTEHLQDMRAPLCNTDLRDFDYLVPAAPISPGHSAIDVLCFGERLIALGALS